MTARRDRPPPRRRFRWSWRSAAFRGAVYQVAAVLAVVAGVAYLVHNTAANMRSRGIQSGFDYLLQPAGFAISESLIPFDSADSFARAFLVGISNTLRVAILGIALATGVGTLIGVARRARNFLVRSLAAVYVETFRNVPLLLQLFIGYFVLTELLPAVDEALRPLPGVYFSKNGLQFPVPEWTPGWLAVVAGLVGGAAAAWGWARYARRRRETTGRAPPVLVPALAGFAALALAGWLAGGAPSALDIPQQSEVSVVGGGALTPEFLTVLIGLTLYTASYIAEIVRAGIDAVAPGQREAAAALGLRPARALRLVVLPQALRVIIPPLTSQYLNLAKNSSLAVAVGYPDLVSISNTTLNQTGRAVEAIALVMAAYLTMSLATAAIMSVYNRRAAIRER